MFIPQNMVIILCMEEILHQLVDGLSIVYPTVYPIIYGDL